MKVWWDLRVFNSTNDLCLDIHWHQHKWMLAWKENDTLVMDWMKVHLDSCTPLISKHKSSNQLKENKEEDKGRECRHHQRRPFGNKIPCLVIDSGPHSAANSKDCDSSNSFYSQWNFKMNTRSRWCYSQWDFKSSNMGAGEHQVFLQHKSVPNHITPHDHTPKTNDYISIIQKTTTQVDPEVKINLREKLL